MFNPNALKYKGFYYNVDAFVMDIGNQFYRECAYYINSLDSTATGIKVTLTEKDNLLYSSIDKEKEAYAYSIDPSIVGFDLMKNLLSNTDNLNSSLFSMGWFSSMDKEAILHTFSDYKKSVGKSASDLGSRLPLWIKWSNFKVLFKDQQYILSIFINALLFATKNVILTCKSSVSDIKNLSLDAIMANINIPMHLLSDLVRNFISNMQLNRPSNTDYVNLPFICYKLVRWVFSINKYSINEEHESVRSMLRMINYFIMNRINSEFKQKEEVSENCILTAQFLISELVSRGFTPAKEIFNNILKVYNDKESDDAALFLFANTYLAAEIGTKPAVPYNNIRLVDSEFGKTAADKAMEAELELQRVKLEEAQNNSKEEYLRECRMAVERADAETRAKDAETASSSATAKPNTINVKNDAAATPGVNMTLPPSNTTALPPMLPSTPSAPPSAPPTPNSATSGTTISTSTPTIPAAPTPTSTVTPGNVAADRPTGFTPRTRRATGRDRQSDWEGLDPTQLAAYNKQVYSEHEVRSKSNFDDYARSFNPSASLTSHTSAIQTVAEFPLSNMRLPTKNKAASRYKSSFGDKEFTTMIYQ